MPLYNLALLFDEGTNKEIINCAEKINKNLNTSFSLDAKSIPHITIFKFEAKKELSKEELTKISLLFKKTFKITFSGLKLLPSKSGGIWIELSVLKNKNFTEIQEKLSKLKNIKILNKIGDSYRPHITLSKIKDKEVNISYLDYSLLRKKNIQGYICLGKAKGGFKFSKI